MKRAIRLKEQTPGIDVELVPPEPYLRRTDGSLDGWPFRLRTSGNGFILTGDPRGDAPAERGRQLFVLGDSFVESSYAPESERWVAAAESLLRRAGSVVTAHNAGYSGATSLQLFNVLINKVMPLATWDDHAVFFVPQNDYDVLYNESAYWIGTDRHSPIVPANGAVGESVDKLDHERLYALLHLIVDAAERFDVPISIATSPFRRSEYADDRFWTKLGIDQSTVRRRIDMRTALMDAVRRFSDVRQVPFFDADRVVGGAPSMFYDELHLNRDGQRAFAAAFSEWASGLLRE